MSEEKRLIGLGSEEALGTASNSHMLALELRLLMKREEVILFEMIRVGQRITALEESFRRGSR